MQIRKNLNEIAKEVAMIINTMKFKDFNYLQSINNCKLEFENIITELNVNIYKKVN